MAVPFLTQLQPFEENQSPSPVEEIPNPYEFSRTRSTSPRRSPPNSPPSPVNTTNNLLRQLSGDPDNPPPAWQRRPSITTQRSGRSSSINSNGDNNTRPHRSPSNSSQSPSSAYPGGSRRRPNLSMTTARPGMPSGMFAHESPNGSSSSLNDDPTLMLPQPAFRRRQNGGGGGGSNRSSIVSNQDLSSLTSEELWSLDHENGAIIADMSNPTRQAQERPLDTVRRMSSRLEHKPYHTGLPGEIIWPSAPPPEELYHPPVKSRSVTSMASLRGNRRMSKSKRNSRQASLDIPNGIISGKQAQMHAKSTPVSPATGMPPDAVMISSNNSSSTSLASHQMPQNKSSVTLGSRPPSAYYSRDFLSSLAPREGGYAIAAQMGNGLGAVGTMSVEERRRSGVLDDHRQRTLARAPMSKSSGMGRWSLDGGEHYGRPYGTSSANTTSTSLSIRASSTPDVSPPADETASRNSYLPEGASPAVGSAGPRNPSLDIPSTAAQQLSSPQPLSTTTPINPSPLSRAPTTAEPQTPKHENLTTGSAPDSAPTTGSIPPPAPIVLAAAKPAAALTPKKSKKELAKEAKAAQKAAKAAEKAEAEKISRQRAAAVREAALKKQADKEAAKKKEKEEKQKRKAEKKASKIKSPSAVNLPFRRSNSSTPVTNNSNAPASSAIPPVPPLPAGTQPAPLVDHSSQATSTKSAVPFPTMSSSQSGQGVSPPAAGPPRQTHASLPLGVVERRNASGTAAPAQHRQVEPKPSRSRLGMLGTIKKRLSTLGSSDNRAPSEPRAVPQVASSSRSTPIAQDVIGSQKSPVAPVAPVAQPQQQQVPTIRTPPQDSVPVLQNSQDLSRIITPPPSTAVPFSPTPVQLSDLPPRSTSRTPDVGSSPTLPSGFASPQSFQTAGGSPVLHRASSHQSPQLINSSPLTKTVSQDRAATGSPSSMRKNSLRGPRPMPLGRPAETRSRPVSISTSSSDHPQSLPIEPSPRLGAPEVVTPSTSGDSAMSLFSHTISTDRTTTDLASPFTSDAGDGDASRKNSMVIDGLDLDKTRQNGVQTPEREGSNETIHPDVTNIAPPVVSAH